MNVKSFLIFITVIIMTIVVYAQNQENTVTFSDLGRESVRFDDDWKFFRGGAEGAHIPHYKDENWRSIEVPHDWSLENLPGTDSPFDMNATSQTNTGFTVGGTGWYRKSFTVESSQKGNRFLIHFEGVYMRSSVWLNGKLLAEHPNGYTPIILDITDKLKFDGANVISVQVQNEGTNSRWYSGSGIYRHVWLVKYAPVHAGFESTVITTPSVSETSAQVDVKSTLLNETNESKSLSIKTLLIDPDGNVLTAKDDEIKIDANSESAFNQVFTVKSPKRWGISSPDLYSARVEVYENEVLVDQVTERFGIRKLSFDAKNGFQLNDETIKLKGGCIHHGNGPLGARAYDRAEERKIELLKVSGYNAVRMAHNPPSPALLRACDEQGMLVIDEAFDQWNTSKKPFDYHLYFDQWWQKDLKSVIRRDVNHPSIIMWSIGNEIPDMDDSATVVLSQKIGDYTRQLDPTRPVTAAVHNHNGKKDPFFETLDVKGYNYGKHKYVEDHERLPNRVMYSSESYALEAFDYWMGVRDNDWVIGDFVWTAFDYIGEASIGWLGYYQTKDFFPWNLAYCGDIDICGWKRPQSYYRDALWMKDQISLFVHPPTPSFEENPKRESWSKWHWQDVVAEWNWDGYEKQKLTVDVYSSCDQVELVLNGKSLGKKKNGRANEYISAWEVPYKAGNLVAIGYISGKEVNRSTLSTATAPTNISISADRDVLKAGVQDLSYITVQLLDEKGRKNPKMDQEVSFEISGSGEIISVANANPMSLESYEGQSRKTWKGRCMVVVKAGSEAGKIILTAKSKGMAAKSVEILVED